MGFSSFSRTSLVMDSKQDCNRPRSAQDLASRMETSSRSAACIVCVGGVLNAKPGYIGVLVGPRQHRTEWEDHNK